MIKMPMALRVVGIVAIATVAAVLCVVGLNRCAVGRTEPR
jgi:hypothetical protein